MLSEQDMEEGVDVICESSTTASRFPRSITS